MTGAALRLARHEDAPALATLGWATFHETFVEGFALPYHPDDLLDFRRREYASETFAHFIADPAARVWAAERGGDIVGYAYAAPVSLPHPDARPGDGELKRLYVGRAAQGLGIGSVLLEAVLGWLDPDRRRTTWIGVWSGNLRAQRLYAAQGYAKAGEYDFPVGRVRDREFILRRLPSAAALP